MKGNLLIYFDSNRLHSVFEKLSPREIKAQREASMKAFTRLPSVRINDLNTLKIDQKLDKFLIYSYLKTALEVPINDIYTTVIDFPKRPPWHYGITKEELEINEEHYFQRWLDDIYNEYPREELGFFEHNLDVIINLVMVLFNL